MEAPIQLTVHIPDEVLAPYAEVMPPPQLGLLEAVAVDAILAVLQRTKAEREKPNA